MASLHKDPLGRSPFWFCAYTSPDSVRHFRSTKTRDEKQAQEICRAWAKTVAIGRTGKLTPEKAREVIAAGVADVFTASNQEAMPSATARDWCKTWLEAKRIEAEETTHERYKGVLDRFLTFLGNKADKDLAFVRVADVAVFRDQQAKQLSRNSANLSVKVLRACLASAVKRQLVTDNPASKVDKLKMRGESKRRNFTAAEIRRVLEACGKGEWRGLVLFGIYTGQRLGDLARLTWRQVDTEKGEVTFVTSKTGRRLILPLAKPLAEYIGGVPSSDDPDAPIFPQSASVYSVNGSTLSNQFQKILVDAGLAQERPHRKTGKGRDTKRPVSEISFHSLRHSAVTFLKAAGASDALAREIIGHESAAVSRGYTHLSTEDLRAAVDKLPDVTRGAK